MLVKLIRHRMEQSSQASRDRTGAYFVFFILAFCLIVFKKLKKALCESAFSIAVPWLVYLEFLTPG